MTTLSCFPNEHQNTGQREQGERHDHEKHPAPAVSLAEIPSGHGTDDRPDDHTHSKQRNHRPMLVFRVGVLDDRLTDGSQRRTTRTLEYPKQNESAQRVRCPTQQRRHGKPQDTEDQQPPATQPGNQPAGHRCCHSRRNNIEGHHPGDLVLGCGQRALQLWQRHIGDGDGHRVEHRDHRTGGQDQPALHSPAVQIYR